MKPLVKAVQGEIELPEASCVIATFNRDSVEFGAQTSLQCLQQDILPGEDCVVQIENSIVRTEVFKQVIICLGPCSM